METNEIVIPETAISAVVQQDMLPQDASPQESFARSFRQSYKLAQTFAKSSLIPQQYQGKVEDCAIAVDMAVRMGVSPLMVMQSLYVVKGKPSWSGQACMSFIKAKYPNAVPVYVGAKGMESRGCYIKAGDLEGPEVNLKMAKAEGWADKPGSKWRTMPELMLAYRAAAFFARIYCPEILMGVVVEGEAEDTAKYTRADNLTEMLIGDTE